MIAQNDKQPPTKHPGGDGRAEKPPDCGRKITARAILKMIEHQKYKCALSGRELTPDVASIDHIQPVSRGGANDMHNVQIVHRDVNQAKSTMSLEEFLTMCREVTEHRGLG